MTNQQDTTPISILGLVIWGVAALFFLYEFFLRTFVGSVAHQVVADLHLSAESFGLISSAYYVAYGLMQVPVGFLADRFGVKANMLFATTLCVGASLLFAHASGFYMALIARVLMGIGSSFAFICLLVTVVTWLPKPYFGFFAGTSQFIGTMGPLLAGGPLIAFMASRHVSWRVALTGISGLGVVLMLAVLIFVRQKPRSITPEVIRLSHNLSFKENIQRLLQNKQAWFVALYSAAAYISIELLGAVWGTEYLQAKGFSQTIAADIISVSWLGYAMGCPLLGAASDLSKRRRPILMLCAITGLLATATLLYAPMAKNTWVCAVLFYLIGLAASGQNVGFATIAEHTMPETRATTMGFNNGTILFSSAILPIVVSLMLPHAGGASQANHLLSSFTLALSVMPCLYLGALILSAFFIKETYCRPQKETIILNRTATI